MTIDRTRVIEKAGDYDILCEVCQHGEVCGHYEDMKEAIKKISGLKMSFTRQPFNFEIHCKHFLQDVESAKVEEKSSVV